MKPWNQCLVGLLVFAFQPMLTASDARAKDLMNWNAFASQIEPEPIVVEGKKKHRHDDFEPTPAPAPAPEPEADSVEPDLGPVEPINKRIRPRPQPSPDGGTDTPDDVGNRNKDRHDTKVINQTVYRTSLFPSVYDCVECLWLMLLSFYLSKHFGLNFKTLFAWK